MQRQDRLDHSGCTGGRLGMTDLRLDRTEGAPWLHCGTVDIAQCRYFHRITDFGAGAVGFHHADTVGRNTGAMIGILDGFLLA